MQPTRRPAALLVVTALLCTFRPASAETPVDRTGTFAQGVPTPKCDGVGDFFKGLGNLAVDGVQYLGEKSIKATLGLGHLVTGNPDALLDEINSTFDDLGSAAADLSKYTPLALASVLVDALPPGAMTDFLRQGVRLQDQLRAQMARGLVQGLNPIQTAETVMKDLGEIGGDLVNVLKNLDDPQSAGNEFLKLQQKWSGAGALTYMLTEQDPMVGLQKALGAIHRQVELVTTYTGAAPKGKVSEALLGVVMEESENFIDRIGDPQQKAAAAVLVGTFATAFASSVSDPDVVLDAADHPFYQAEIRDVDTEWMRNDHNSGGTYDWGLLHPVVENKHGCISLGDYAYRGSIDRQTLKAVCGVEGGREKWWSRPVDYQLVWGDNCSGATHDRSIWKPVCREGFVSVGFVAWGGSWQKPLPNRIACLKDDLSLLRVVDGGRAGLRFVANDANSGSKYDGTVYNRQFAGMDLMYAVPYIRSPEDVAFVQSLRVPIPTTTPAAAAQARLAKQQEDEQRRQLAELERRRREAERDLYREPAQAAHGASYDTGEESGEWDDGVDAEQAQPAATGYTHQLFFAGDEQNAYYLTSASQLVRFDAYGNATVVGQAVASQNPAFSWMIQDVYGRWYGVDGQGGIWSWDASGNAYHAGGVQALSR